MRLPYNSTVDMQFIFSADVDVLADRDPLCDVTIVDPAVNFRIFQIVAGEFRPILPLVKNDFLLTLIFETCLLPVFSRLG